MSVEVHNNPLVLKPPGSHKTNRLSHVVGHKSEAESTVAAFTAPGTYSTNVTMSAENYCGNVGLTTM